MKSRDRVLIAAAAGALALAGCAGGGRLAPAETAAPGGVSDSPVVVGLPYTVNGVTYTPADPERYDEVGYASWYGEELGGRPTANGEAFVPQGISAAHRTLPLPSYAEVTALDTGRTVLVRINDRGPFTPDRLIDLSAGAMRQLGAEGRGSVPVRVRRVYPPEGDRARLRSGRPAAERLPASPQLLDALRSRLAQGSTTIPAARPPEGEEAAAAATIRTVPVPPPDEAPPGVTWQRPSADAAASAPAPPAAAPAVGDWFVQLGAFANADNAERLARRAAGLGDVRVVPGGSLRYVRLGPFADADAARAAQARARSAGYADARIHHDR